MAVLLIIAAVAGYYFLSRTWTLYRNYCSAVNSGLPYILCPIDNSSIFWVIVQIPLSGALQHVLPASWYDRLRLTVMGWEFVDKGVMHERIGPTFIVVTAGNNELWTADPGMAQIMLARRKDFGVVPISAQVMSFLGENILTSDGEMWARQRRIIAPNLNERISESVWDESGTQAHQMADYMLNQPGGESRDTVDSLKAIAINVLGQVGYGQPKPFKPISLPRDPNAKMTYIDAISICTELLVLAALAPKKIMALPFMPRVFRTVAAALNNLPKLTADMLDEERKRIASTEKEGVDRSSEKGTFMSQLVRLSDVGKISDIHNAPTGQYLTDSEIAGNLFIFTGAGFDTTANTMTYAVGLLAAYPEWQEWIQEELDQVLSSTESKTAKNLDYTTYFPQLKRVLALMMETLRLFPPVLHLSRSVKHDQSVTIHGQTHVIANPCTVFISNPGLAHSRSIWGDDADMFRPSRWLTNDGANAEIITPARGTFLPWSGGPRVCPGQKMAQVEFVTVFSALFSRLRIEPVPSPTQSPQEARNSILDLLQDSTTRLTLQINKPENLNLRWAVR